VKLVSDCNKTEIAMPPTLANRTAAAMGLLAVVLGAFGAHGLKDLLAQNGTAFIARGKIVA